MLPETAVRIITNDPTLLYRRDQRRLKHTGKPVCRCVYETISKIPWGVKNLLTQQIAGMENLLTCDRLHKKKSVFVNVPVCYGPDGVLKT